MEEGDRQERNNFGENRSEILFFFLIKLKVVFFRKKNLKSILYKEEGRESKEGTSLEAKLSFL